MGGILTLLCITVLIHQYHCHILFSFYWLRLFTSRPRPCLTCLGGKQKNGGLAVGVRPGPGTASRCWLKPPENGPKWKNRQFIWQSGVSNQTQHKSFSFPNNSPQPLWPSRCQAYLTCAALFRLCQRCTETSAEVAASEDFVDLWERPDVGEISGPVILFPKSISDAWVLV